MKVFLFLYPIQEYVDACIQNFRFFEYYGCRPDRLNDIITARYRSKGYRVYWLFFSEPNKPELADLSRTSGHIRIEDEDGLIACGLSFEEHVARKVYPDINQILSCLPDDLERLVVGGFHQSDCVDKVAAAVYHQGTPTFVDEDTTEFFFRASRRQIPLTRRRHTLRGFGITDPFWAQLILERRKNKPWLTQLPS